MLKKKANECNNCKKNSKPINFKFFSWMRLKQQMSNEQQNISFIANPQGPQQLQVGGSDNNNKHESREPARDPPLPQHPTFQTSQVWRQPYDMCTLLLSVHKLQSSWRE